MIDKCYCMSSYLAFRYVVGDQYAWNENKAPRRCSDALNQVVSIGSENEIDSFLNEFIKHSYSNESGLLLSGGIDSAIIASYLPKGTKVFTIRFNAEGAIDESTQASRYAKAYQLDHEIIEVTWGDYVEMMDGLMLEKGAPLHAVEVGLYKASMIAHKKGIRKLFLGNGADSNFGGMDKLLSKDWTFDEFVSRYTFIKPDEILTKSTSILSVYESFRRGKEIDYISFLREIHGKGIIQAFENAITAGGCELVEPFENMKLNVPLDLERIRSGESKYLLRSIFKKRYPEFEIPDKIPFARPMDCWLRDWEGPRRSEFKKNCVTGLTGDQKWLVYALERFLDLLD